jgi:GT2 family glycosyltransferase
MAKDSKYPLVSFISINYNQSAVTLEFLESLTHLTYPNYEIIIVDNASPSDNPDRIKEEYPNIHLIKSKKNLGFAGGNNLGILNSKGKYLLFINNDTEVDPDFLEPMVEAFENDKTLGMVSPKIIFHHHKAEGLMQYAGGVEINYTKGVGGFIGYGEIDKGQYRTSYTHLIHGAAVMVPRELMKTVGVWPDIYFLYYEEIDWSEHFKRSGYKLKFIAESTIYHKESLSIGKATPIRIYYMNRNRQLFIRRNGRFVNVLSATIYFYLASVPKSTVTFLIKGKFKLLASLWKAIFWNFTHHFGLKEMPLLVENNTSTQIIKGFYQYN